MNTRERLSGWSHVFPLVAHPHIAPGQTLLAQGSLFMSF
jgi:hypothetical protein